ncbi:hypothetical protein MJO28_005199 [Puccinia striiformis f. sp. tritici]|uniref:Uncharacterized protein n=1 Tax=Puccinia striiformis f. sp. tritici TaxID=168172 RepID=A0ACC0EKS1_9BASI|nr:hypothetical protein MJO28_005199 [Puccinia striiformis f. sp. tritici]
MEAHPDPVTPTSQRQPADVRVLEKSTGRNNKLLIQEEFRGDDPVKLYAEIKRHASARSIETPKDLQIRANVVLAQQKNCFTLAGTGFGKTRIAEMFYNLFPRKKKPIVMVLNPLDSLGDNQVEEKARVHLSAVNLTKLQMIHRTAMRILKGAYAFIYLSPEVFLNSHMFQRLFLKEKFLSKVVLAVIDEAHMIYMWGLVASDRAKQLKSHGKIQDLSSFRPGYGNIGAKLMAMNVSTLLMSATCRPQAVDKILVSLKITPDNITFVRGELSRPEITIWRIPMKHSLSSGDDLLQLFGREEFIPDGDIPPTIIYSSTRHLTLQVLRVLNDARGKCGQLSPKSTFARRYHACTGDLDKKQVIEDFESGVFPVISSTMALGLGQNWSRVRRVVHVGRGDPATIFQMIGRCGRGGNPGLAIMFVDPVRRNGKNKVSDFTNHENQNDDDRMDGLAITPVCLRVSFAIDNNLGYIPLSKEDPNVEHEVAREIAAGFPACMCSNCVELSPEAVSRLIHMDNYNFERSIVDPANIPALGLNVPFQRVASGPAYRVAKGPLTSRLEEQAKYLVGEFNTYFYQHFELSLLSYTPQKFFNLDKARALVIAAEDSQPVTILERLIGGEVVEGQMLFLLDRIAHFKNGDAYLELLATERIQKQAVVIKKAHILLFQQLKARLRPQKSLVTKQELEHKKIVREEAARLKREMNEERARLNREKNEARKRQRD